MAESQGATVLAGKGQDKATFPAPISLQLRMKNGRVPRLMGFSEPEHLSAILESWTYAPRR